MRKEGSKDLKIVINTFFVLILIVTLLFVPKIVGIFDTNRARFGYTGENNVSVERPLALSFDVSTEPTLVEVLHPILYENAVWDEIIEVTSDSVNVGINISVRANILNSISYRFENSGIEKQFDPSSNFTIFQPDDKLIMTMSEGEGCTNCVSLTFYDLWNFVGSDGSLQIKMSVNIIEWGENWKTILIADVIIIGLFVVIWLIGRKSLDVKGYT